jgi:Ser/Thr protein kinase RdoA (MazF antagonist)
MLMPNADLKDPDFNLLIESYSELRTFPHHQLDLIPLLRGYRIITYAIWILNRWSDPSFPRLFPTFNSYNYWAEEAESLTKISHSF